MMVGFYKKIMIKKYIKDFISVPKHLLAERLLSCLNWKKHFVNLKIRKSLTNKSFMINLNSNQKMKMETFATVLLIRYLKQYLIRFQLSKSKIEWSKIKWNRNMNKKMKKLQKSLKIDQICSVNNLPKIIMITRTM